MKIFTSFMLGEYKITLNRWRTQLAMMDLSEDKKCLIETQINEFIRYLDAILRDE